MIVFRSETITSARVFTDEQLSAAEFAREHTAPHSLFLTAPSLRQSVLSFAGRSVLSSATAWLWSHGYEFRERDADVRRIYAGAGDALDLLRYYQVDYIYFGDAETSDLRSNSAFFDQNFAAVYSSPRQRAYQTSLSIAAHHGLSVQVLDDLRESDFGTWEGLSRSEVEARPGRKWRRGQGGSGGETRDDFSPRTRG